MSSAPANVDNGEPAASETSRRLLEAAADLLPTLRAYQEEIERERRLSGVHAVAQAATVLPEWYPVGGRVFLGLDAGPMVSDDRASVSISSS